MCNVFLFMKDMASQQDGFVSHLVMEFKIIDEAWLFWRDYGGKKGFGVRKSYGVKSKKDDIITSYVLVCQCEGTRGNNKRDHLTKNPRAETRTNCKAHLQMKFDRGYQK
jgi:FAR1 DNA-binding domain